VSWFAAFGLSAESPYVRKLDGIRRHTISIRFSPPLSHRIGVDPCKKACLLVRQTDGDSVRDLGDHFRRALGWTPFVKPSTLAEANTDRAAMSVKSGSISELDRPRFWNSASQGRPSRRRA
jgi:hypothetical protein